MLFLLLLQVVAITADGASASGKPAGSITFKLEWGTLTIPLAEIDRLDLCPVREAVMADLAGHVNRGLSLLDGTEPEKGEEQLRRLGPAALDLLTPIAEFAMQQKAERLWRVIQAIQAAGPQPSIDRIAGPGLSARGWVTSETFLVGGAKVAVASGGRVTAVKTRERAGGLVVRMTDGTILAGKFGKGTLRVGTTDVPLESIRTLIIAPGGKAHAETPKAVDGKIEGKTIPFEGVFGTIDLPLKSVGAVMRADWSLYGSPKVDEQGFIRDWIVFGNLPLENDQFEANHLDAIEEAAVVPSAGEEMFGRTWLAFASPRTDLSLLEALPMERKENFVAYGAIYLRASRATPCLLYAQSDDGIRAWLNGELVHSNHVHRGIEGGLDAVPVTLQAGWNRLLVKVDNGGGPSGWRIRFVDEKQRPVNDVVLSLKAPPIFQGR